MNCIENKCSYFKVEQGPDGEYYAICEYADICIDNDCECPKEEDNGKIYI